MATVPEDLQQVITDYADLLDNLDVPGSSQSKFVASAEAIADRALALRDTLDSDRRESAALLAEIATSCQSLAQGSSKQLLGRHGLRIRMIKLGLIG